MILNIDCVEKIFIAPNYIDFRKGINGLVDVVIAKCSANPYENHLFIFFSKNRRKVKMLYWEKTGFLLIQKNLETDKFKWRLRDDTFIISKQELIFLLDGIDISQIKPFTAKNYLPIQ